MAKKTKGPHLVDVLVGACLRKRRTLIGMSQENLGAAVGLTFQQIQKYEKGSNRISASKLVEFAHALDVPPAYFFESLPKSVLKGTPAGQFKKGAFAQKGAYLGGTVSRLDYETSRHFADIPESPGKRQLARLIKLIARGDMLGSGLAAKGRGKSRPSKVVFRSRLGSRRGTRHQTATGRTIRAIAGGRG